MDGGASLVLLAHLERKDGHQDDDCNPDKHSDHDESRLGLLAVLVLGQDTLSKKFLLSFELFDLLCVLLWVLGLADSLGRLGRDPGVRGGTDLIQEALSTHAVALYDSKTLKVASLGVGVAVEACEVFALAVELDPIRATESVIVACVSLPVAKVGGREIDLGLHDGLESKGFKTKRVGHQLHSNNTVLSGNTHGLAVVGEIFGVIFWVCFA